MTRPADLLDIAPVTAHEYAAIEDQCREVLGTTQDIFVFQGEATVALEAAARGLGRPGCVAINLVSGPYGATFGDWLSAAGARAQDVAVPFDRAVRPDELVGALERTGAVDIVSAVHAEAAKGWSTTWRRSPGSPGPGALSSWWTPSLRWGRSRSQSMTGVSTSWC